jgi:hypothetical protein
MIRGPHYMTDKKKVRSTSAIGKLICLENLVVDVAREGMLRHDHVASRGATKQRIEAVLSLQDPPFLFVMNFQIPGDPPVSLCMILYCIDIVCRYQWSVFMLSHLILLEAWE